MSEPISDLKLRVCQLSGKRLNPSLLDTLDNAGIIYEVHEDTLDSVTQADASGFDCALVDWRDANLDVAKFFLALAGRVPTIALINSDHIQHDLDMIAGFNDFVCEQEIGLASFALAAKTIGQSIQRPYVANLNELTRSQVIANCGQPFH